MHLSSGLHPLVYLLLFSEHPRICPLAAKCFLFPRRQQWAEGQNRLCLLSHFPGTVSAHPPAFPCLPDGSPPRLLFQVGQESVLLAGREAPVDRPPRSQRSPHLHRRQHPPGRHGHHRLSPGRRLSASLLRAETFWSLHESTEWDRGSPLVLLPPQELEVAEHRAAGERCPCCCQAAAWGESSPLPAGAVQPQPVLAPRLKGSARGGARFRGSVWADRKVLGRLSLPAQELQLHG